MKLTKQFDGSKVVPYYLGVYKTIDDGYYQYWNGTYWGLCMESIDSAFQHRECKSVFQSPTWRGIKK